MFIPDFATAVFPKESTTLLFEAKVQIIFLFMFEILLLSVNFRI